VVAEVFVGGDEYVYCHLNIDTFFVILPTRLEQVAEWVPDVVFQQMSKKLPLFIE
jgi:hypothetical protein